MVEGVRESEGEDDETVGSRSDYCESIGVAVGDRASWACEVVELGFA